MILITRAKGLIGGSVANFFLKIYQALILKILKEKNSL